MIGRTDKARLHSGFIARGFEHTERADGGDFYQHANGNSAARGKGKRAVQITDESGTRYASDRDRYFVMQDGDLLFFNGIRTTRNAGKVGA